MIFCYRNGLWNLLNWWIFGILVLGLSVRFNWISKKIWRKIRVLCKCFCGEWSAFWKKKKELLLDKFSTYWGKEEIPATMYSLWGTMGLMLRNVGVMKFCNRSSIAIWTFWLYVPTAVCQEANNKPGR